MANAVSAAGTTPGVRPISHGNRTSRRAVWLVLICCGALSVIAPLITTTLLGAEAYDRRDYPGLFTGVGTAVLQGIAEISGWISVGALISALALQPVTRAARLYLRDRIDLVLLRVASTIWAGSAFLLVSFHGADSNGVSVRRVLEPGALGYFIEASFYPRAWLVTAIAASVISVLSWLGLHWHNLLIPLWLAVFAALAPVVVGAVLVGPNHDFASDAAIIQTILLATIGGTVAVLTVRLARGELIEITAIRRFFTIATVAFPIVLVCELVIVWFKLVGTSPLESLTGWLSLVRIACFLGLWALAVIGRSSLNAGRSTAKGLTRFFTTSAALLFVSLAAHVTLTRFLSPQYYVPVSTAEIFFGFDVDPAPGATVLLTHWRPNILFGAIAVFAVFGYLTAVRSLRRRRVRWPRGRTTAWVLGWIAVVTATSSGLGKYSGADFAIHMGVHMTLNMLAPLLLAMGGVVTLLLRALPTAKRDEPTGWREWIVAVLNWRVSRTLYNPLLVFGLYIASYYGLYFTSAFESLVRYHWAHQLMNVHFIIVGYLFYSLVIGVDRTPRQLPHIGRLGFVLAAMPFHAFFGVVLMTGNDIIAEGFYRVLDQTWATDLLKSQYIGGGIAWAGGEPVLLIVVLVLGVQWARSDAREARRKDRHYDQGIDLEFEAYNDMMRQLAARSSGASQVTAEKAPANNSAGREKK